MDMMDESKVRLNKLGRVRPRKYNSKYIKLKKQRLECDNTNQEQQKRDNDKDEQSLPDNENGEQSKFENENQEQSACDNEKQEQSKCDENQEQSKCDDENQEPSKCDNENQDQSNCDNENQEPSKFDNGIQDQSKFDNENQEQSKHDNENQEQSKFSEKNTPHADLFEFMKQRDETMLEELMFKIRKEKEWDPCDIDTFEETDENACTDTSADVDSPVQPGHSMTLSTAVLLIWLLSITHSFTSCQLSDTLTLINLFLLEENSAFKSLYRFKRVFRNFRSQYVKHFYCNFCQTPVAEDLLVCPNGVCLKDLSCKGSKDYFLELPIPLQLENLFSRSDFRDGLKHRNERIKKKSENIEDVYDSERYKRLSSPGGPLSEQFKNNVSFTLNTDGVPIFKSSKFSVWPIFLMINELPFKMRKNQNNMLLCGLWYGQTKPVANLFCQPLHQAMNELERGIQITVSHGEKAETVPVRGFLFCLSCDTPARAMMLNMNQHNGEFACPKCIQKGCNHRTSAGGNIRIFPYDTDNPSSPERIHQQCIDDASQSVKTNSTVNGIKGPSVLMFCPQFDCVKNVGIDYMHLICLGLVRLLLKLWFGVSYSLEGFSLYRLTDVVDSRITAIKPPHFISRTPRSVKEHLKFWKASELRSWLFFYSLPCVMDLLKPKYLYHYCCFVEGIFLLNQASISMSDIENSQRLLNYFVFMFPALYGERYLTINMHSLVHLPKTVRELGPLWCVSCFAFESANGELLKLFHGTQYIDVQILNAVHIHQLLPSLVGSTCMTADNPVLPFVKSLLKEKESRSGFSVCGKGHQLELAPDLRILVCGFLRKPAIDVTYHGKACLRGIMYSSKHYSGTTLRNSYTVKFINKRGFIDFGYIQWFANDSNSSAGNSSLSENNDFCCISVLKEEPINVFNRNHLHDSGAMPDQLIESNFLNLHLHFLHVMKPSKEFVIVPLTSVVEMCVCVIVDDYVFICEEPNHQELNL